MKKAYATFVMISLHLTIGALIDKCLCYNLMRMKLNLRPFFYAHTGDTNSNPKSEIKSPSYLSWNALKGGSGVGPIRFITHINTLPMKVLVDGGSSDNFWQPRVANFLKLHVETTPLFKVMVGNGNYMTIKGIIRVLNIQA